MSYYKKLKGERVYLSPIDASEVDLYVKWMNDRAVVENFNEYSSVISSRNDLGWLYDPPKNMQRYAIVLYDSDELIGSISIHNIDGTNRSAFVGIFIGEETRRSKGYGAEALRLIVNYGFKTLNMHSINLTVHADNYAGIACYKKVGFREVGRLPEALYINGGYIDKLYMCILESDFAV